MANSRLPSLANYPLDIVLLIIEALFEPRQIITVEILLLLFLHRYALRLAGPSSCLLYRKTVPSQAG